MQFAKITSSMLLHCHWLTQSLMVLKRVLLWKKKKKVAYKNTKERNNKYNILFFLYSSFYWVFMSVSVDDPCWLAWVTWALIKMCFTIWLGRTDYWADIPGLNCMSQHVSEMFQISMNKFTNAIWCINVHGAIYR